MELIFILGVVIVIALIILMKKNKAIDEKSDKRKFSAKNIVKEDCFKFDDIKVEKEELDKLIDVNYLPVKILTKTEIIFFDIIKKALPEYYIFTQVCTSAILKATSKNGQNYMRAKNTYNRTFIDFVICDMNFEIVALIELDDKTHDNKKEKDRIRDYITTKAGYKTMRFDCRNMPTVNEVKKLF